MRKYKYTGETKVHFGTTLHQIVAIKSFGDVAVGDVGGWIEQRANLSDTNDAWVSGDARVSGDAEVYGNARVSGNAEVYGDARVSGNAEVYGDARVYGNAWVYGNARVSGNAEVVTKPVSIVNVGTTYPVCITDTHITIGCQNHEKSWWADAGYDEIDVLDGPKSASLWMKYKPFIMMIANEE